MKKVLAAIISLSLCLMSISGCNSSKASAPIPAPPSKQSLSQSFLSIPDQIILYKDGKAVQLDRESKDYAEIVRLTNERFNNKITVVQNIVDNDYVNGLKNNKESLSLEFVYAKERSMKIKNDDLASFKYNRLFFLLVDNVLSSAQPSVKTELLEYGDLTNFKGSSRGALAASKDLIDLVLRIK